MVRLNRAACAEVLVASVTADSVFAHVDCRLLGDSLALVVLLVVVYFTLNQLHHVLTAALNQIRVLPYQVELLFFL